MYIYIYVYIHVSNIYMFTPYTLNPEQDWLHLRGALRGRCTWCAAWTSSADC